MIGPSREPQAYPFTIVGTHKATSPALIQSATCKESSFVAVLVAA